MSTSTSDDEARELEPAPADRIAGALFDHLRSLVTRLRADHSDKKVVRGEACAATLLAVNAVDVFLNMWTGVMLSDHPDAFLQETVLGDFHVGVHHKLKTWPVIVCGRFIDERDPRWVAFEKARSRRNMIVHFGWSKAAAIHPIYDGLDLHAAEEALAAAEGVVCLLLEAVGETAATMPEALHRWIGKAPDLQTYVRNPGVLSRP